MSGKFQNQTLKSRAALWVLPSILAAMLIAALILIRGGGMGKNVPTLTVETPQKLSASQRETFTLDVTISDLGDVLYPAMSMSIAFDASCLEFIGIEEGNVFITDKENTTGRKLPDWSCNPDQCNKTGRINIMYLDMTGGDAAFTKDLLAEEDNVVLRLSFRLRGSARRGDVFELVVEDAVFAASDETKSLAVSQKTLKTKNAKLVIGD